MDAWRFEAAVDAAAAAPPGQALEHLENALALWRGPAYAEAAADAWVRAERSPDRAAAAGRRAAGTGPACPRAGRRGRALDAHVAEHPWREEAWRLLALALYRAGRQADALAVLRRARAMLADRLGVDPGPRLRRLEADVLAQDPRPDPPAEPVTAAARLWTRAAEAYDRTVAAGARSRLESTVGLLRNLAVTGGSGLAAAREHRLAAVTAAEEFGDPELIARVIGAYDVPAIWPRSDDPEQARQIVAAAERTLTALPDDTAHEVARCRLLATIALEMRGTRSPRGPQAAREAEETARRLDDLTLLAFALNGAFMQSCTRAGLAPRRDVIGEELIALAARHGLVNFEVLGHLIRIQANSALGDFTTADEHPAAADALAERHERPLVCVFTHWYRALRLAASGQRARAGTAYRAAARLLDGAGMPGVEHGLLPLARLCLHLADATTPASRAAAHIDPAADTDWGPYAPWAEPFVLLRTGRHADARARLHTLPEPPADLLYEVLCCLHAALTLELGDQAALQTLRTRLQPASGELAGAGSGLVTLGPVDHWLAALGTT
ncbi:BTAD domain-containing putative transcriptional regulator [Streptomyces sp. TRM68367]|uniref:BTAD domain-containing putative transcriptional regulator n=1 Tax=Streptomyces sp. TRM68367 TaxID=2758415 RepID=UPI002934B33A|nr:BTAD domain-containing putative transcriptional regulator [Streptomyces sp. TRM68367]